MKKILVLGAGGFIGKSLCQKLSKNNYVIAFDRFLVSEFRCGNNIKSIQGNFNLEYNFDKILLGVDTVVHLISTTVPVDTTENITKEIVDNVVPTLAFLEAMVRMNVREIVFASSGGTVYGDKGDRYLDENESLDPISTYGLQKKLIEDSMKFYANKYGIKLKIARISNPYGVGQDSNKKQGIIPIFMQKNILEEEITIYGDGNNVRDYIYIDDLIDTLVSLVEYSGKEYVFNIGSGSSHSINEIVNLIEKTTNKKFKYINYLPVRNCDVKINMLNIEKTKKILGSRDAIGIKNGICKIFLDIYI